MVPIIFDAPTSVFIIGLLALAAYLARRQHKKLQADYRTQMVPWDTMSLILWVASFLIFVQLVAQLPTYL